jgi:hypothetical protein
MDNEKTTCKFCSEEISISDTVCPHCDSGLKQEDSKDPLELKADAVETDTAESTDTGQPELWNPNAAANWSFLFTVIFGAYLHAKNWQTLGKEELAKKSMYWMYGGIGSIVLYLFLPESAFDYILLFGPLLGWYFTMAKAQAKYLKENNIEYTSKPWIKPIGIGAGCLVLFMLIGAMFGGMTAEDIEGTWVIDSDEMREDFVNNYKGSKNFTESEIDTMFKRAQKEFDALAFTYEDGMVKADGGTMPYKVIEVADDYVTIEINGNQVKLESYGFDKLRIKTPDKRFPKGFILKRK